jgi:hypothetical protein
MNSPARFDAITLDELRKRLHDMNDMELVRFCRLCSQLLSIGEAPSQPLVELEEAEAEWRRRQQRWFVQP